MSRPVEKSERERPFEKWYATQDKNVFRTGEEHMRLAFEAGRSAGEAERDRLQEALRNIVQAYEETVSSLSPAEFATLEHGRAFEALMDSVARAALGDITAGPIADKGDGNG